MKLATREVPQRLGREGPPAAVLLYGQEQGLAHRLARQIRRAVLSVADEEMDAETLYGADFDPGRFLSGCNAFPFFAKRRFVLLRDADSLAVSARDTVLNYLKSPAKSAVLVILAGPLEARSPLRKAFEAHKTAWCLPCYSLEGRDLVNWIVATLQEAGFTADPDAVAMLAERLEGDARNAESELEKLCLFVGAGRRITAEEVLESVGGGGNQNSFSLAQAVLAGRTGAALTILDGLLDAGEEPLMLLGMLIQRLRRLIQAGGMLDGGKDPEAVAMALQVFWKEKGEFFAQVRGIGSRRLASGLLRCQEADRELKSGGEPRRVMERLVMALCRLASGDPASGAGPARTAAAPRRSPWP